MSYTFWHYCPSDNVKLFFSSDIIFFSSLWFLTVPDESMNLEIKLISSFKVAFHVLCMRVQHSEKNTSQNRMHVIGRCFFSIELAWVFFVWMHISWKLWSTPQHTKKNAYSDSHKHKSKTNSNYFQTFFFWCISVWRWSVILLFLLLMLDLFLVTALCYRSL